ncbi:kinase-like protein [Acephala macrosclerotiorum]|nr:kinase-like protein [Acephala macrosclerotiorum]
MEAAKQLGVRVPAAKRAVTFNGDTYLIMERIDGVTLEEAWPKLGWFTTVKLALQLRWVVRLLRSSTSSIADPCPAVITSFIQFWTRFTSFRQAMKTAIQDPVPPTTFIPATPNTLVFTHHDLAPRNLLLDRLGQLWVLDWDYAGWYPRYFEYAAMQNFPFPQVWTRFARARWFLFTWITVGRFERERKALECIRTKFTSFAFGRRFEILAGRSPTRRPVS